MKSINYVPMVYVGTLKDGVDKKILPFLCSFSKFPVSEMAETQKVRFPSMCIFQDRDEHLPCSQNMNS